MRIIDGYNVIGAAGEFGLALSLPDKEDRLLRLLSSFRSRRRSRQAMLVVFDGHYGKLAAGPRRYSHLGIQVEWALGETADAVIARKVRSAARAAGDRGRHLRRTGAARHRELRREGRSAARSFSPNSPGPSPTSRPPRSRRRRARPKLPSGSSVFGDGR